MTATSKRMRPHPLLWSRYETKQRLGIGLTKLDELIKDGRLVRVRIGRRSLITDESISRLITELSGEGTSATGVGN